MITNLTSDLAMQTISAAQTISQEYFAGRHFSVAVCDKQGFLLAFSRMDNAKLLTIELTQRKAYTSSRLGVATADFLSRLQNEKLDIHYFGDERFTALPGGVAVYNSDKQLVGGLAVGGLSAQEDHDAAQAFAQFLNQLIQHDF